ncbi:MAG: sigma-54 dependent transcriptional regulator [Gemmatimonadales bacterium]|nr:sigma-54 dependent transcriptional regulator [Gemmatimonadales bacterium]
MPSIVFLSRRPRLYSAAAQWDLPEGELYLYDSPSEALAKMSLGQTAVFVFDSRDYPRFKHVIRKFLSMKSDADLVLIGQESEITEMLELEHDVAIQVVPATADHEEVYEAVLRRVLLRRVRQSSGMVGRSRSIDQLLSMIAHAAPLDVNILVLGESGTGKELVARAIHENSSRQKGPFISLNCGALTESLLESELFGHVRGAFTGAVGDHPGVFERANRGTLFLDEVGELPLGMQTRFLRTLETGEFTPVGGRIAKKCDIRLVAATNQDLASEVAGGRFRQDLYYRLRVVVLNTPALRDRVEDIPVLTESFLDQENKRHGLHVRGLTRAAELVLLDHDWPGNVRELRNTVSSAVVMKQRGLIDLADLPAELRLTSGPGQSGFLPVALEQSQNPPSLDLALLATTMLELRQDIKEIKSLLQAGNSEQETDPSWPLSPKGPLQRTNGFVETYAGDSGFTPLQSEQVGDLQTAERTLIEAALRSAEGNRRKAANKLGISERTLYRKIKLFGLA